MRGYDQFAQGFFISLIFLFSMQYVVPEDSILHLYLIAAWIGFLGGVIFPDSDCYGVGLFDSLFHPKKIFTVPENKRGSTLFRWPRSSEKYVDWSQDPEARDKWKQRNAARKFKLFLSQIAAIFIIPSMYFFRYLIYKPGMFILKRIMKKYPVKEEHRHISHSIFGVLIASIIYSFYWLILDGVSILINLKRGVPLERILITLPHYDLAIMAGAGFFIGTLIHLVQDSICTAKLRIFYPFGKKILSGNYDFKDPFYERMVVLITIIFLLMSGLLLAYYPVILNQFLKFVQNFWLVLGFTLVFDFLLVIIIYLIFFKIFKVRIYQE